MNVQELIARFPEIPATLRGEPLLATFAATFDDLLRRARPPSPCATVHDAANHLYLALVGPLAIHGYGLSSREQVVGEIGDLLARHRGDPQGFEASLLPTDVGSREVRGPGCA